MGSKHVAEWIIVLQNCVLMVYQFTSYLCIHFLEAKVVYLPINTSYVVWVKNVTLGS
jgi:hypothetical protein